ncbi:histidine-type phosphatase [Cutibacterium equinum]|uniref:Multiple inositol polyphosphate phosphatase 1 n=1 Tax=Cutibacterium equinum TaxID=3016342 RepID=A0ABY7QXE2_9ACTN|nr:histidine-type phosphatase [Cutibacterium equinum]WCC79340.1 histidine-type phosphatase [Cutibacterium equinum]
MTSTPLRVLGAVTVACLAVTCAPTAHADTDDSMSTKTPYRYSGGAVQAPPAGFHPVNTQVVARHGSRGLSSFKYDALTMAIWEKADELGAVTPLGRDVYAQTMKLHEANENLGNEDTWSRMKADGVELSEGNTLEKGYGNLTELGAQQHRHLGERLAHRMPEALHGDDDSIVVESSGEPRAAESGYEFVTGLLHAAPHMKGHMSRAIKAHPETLYFHKDKSNSDYKAYQEYKDSKELSDYVDAVNSRPEVRKAAREVLEKIYTKDFVDRLAAGEWTFTTPEGKKAKNEVDAALNLYNLYIIAPSMAAETKVDFAKYFTIDQANVFAMSLDAEDYAEKGPGFKGSDIAYRNARPLLDDFLAQIDQQIKDHPEGSATLRFAHAETLIPFEALIGAPGSRTQISPEETNFWQATDWRGSKVAPLASNVQWDVFESSSGQKVVRMLLNEQQATFGRGCRPITANSFFYTVDELKHCLTGASIADGGWLVKPAGDESPTSPSVSAPTATPSKPRDFAGALPATGV